MRSLFAACLLVLISLPSYSRAEGSYERTATYQEEEIAIVELLETATTADRKPSKQQIIYATSICCPQYGGTPKGEFCFGHNGNYSHSSPCFQYALTVLQQEEGVQSAQQAREQNIIKITENEISHFRDWYNFDPSICNNPNPQGGMDPRCCGPFGGTPEGACY